MEPTRIHKNQSATPPKTIGLLNSHKSTSEPSNNDAPGVKSYIHLHTNTHNEPNVTAALDTGSSITKIQKEYRDYINRKRLIVVSFLLIMLVFAVVSICTGSSKIDIFGTLYALTGQGDPYTVAVVWSIRMPHILTALIGGWILAICGCSLQSILANPLASPSTLGIAQGAAFGASIAIITLGAGTLTGYDTISFNNPYATVLCAFIGACLSMLVILGISRFNNLTPEAIILTGVALSALFTGTTALIQYFAEDTQIASVVFWTFGSLRRTDTPEIAIMATVAILSSIFFFADRHNLNAMESGEGNAHSVGTNVNKVRNTNMVVATLASASVIAFCGTINFIGLIAPHIARKVVGSDYRYLLPASAFAGASCLLLGDIIASVAIPGVILPISAITSFVGAPIFIYLLAKRHH